MNIVGPTRLVLLRAGKYDYGEVELINPLHLVGPNNIGKTSLIAVLQFLYIDDQRVMHFSRELAETRKYYFPDQNSYLLFECLTPEGYQVLGVQGLGPIRGYEFRRFAYQGQYDPDDYLDADRRIRTAEEIHGRLASREFHWLEPRNLRAALTGQGDNRGVNLGLVPIRQANHYERFRAVFGNLLRLAHLRQEELKKFLLEIHWNELQQRTIDLEVGYASQYRQVCEEATSLRELRVIVDDVRRALELAATRDDLRQLLPGLWQEIRTSYEETEAEFREQTSTLEAAISQRNEKSDQCGAEEKKCQAERDIILKDIGTIEAELKRHEKERERFRNFLVDIERGKKAELERRIDTLAASLGRAEDVSVDQVRIRVGRMEKELARLQLRRELFSRNVAGKLLPLIPDGTMEDIFRLINPEILGLVHGENGLQIKEEQLLGEALTRWTGRMQDGVYEDDRVRVALESLKSPDLAAYRDADVLDRQIVEHEEVLTRERRILEAAENTDRIKREKEQAQKERDRIQNLLDAYREFQQSLPLIQRRLQEKQNGEKREAELTAQLAELASQKWKLAEERRQFEERLREVGKRREKVRGRLRSLTAPDPSWPVVPYIAEREVLDALIERYERKGNEHSNVARRLAEELRRIEQHTYQKYVGEDEAETLANLRAELDALEEKEKAVQKLWKGLATSLQNAFKGLHKDLETLKSRIQELNRRLGGVSISNLARLRLQLQGHPEWMERIKTVVQVETMPLFFDSNRVNEAQNKLGELLKQHRRVELSDLFDLHFEVTTTDGQTRQYPHLDTIESNGTTITIKVLINLLLLKGLLSDKEVSIPFYLDEASSLDRENLASIVQEAKKMGFIAVLASPEAMEAADALYFLRETNSRIMLDPKTSLLRIERRGDHDR